MLKKVAWISAGLLLLIQFVRPDFSPRTVDPGIDLQQAANPPAEVLTILRNACYDCHSDETKYPWYSQVAPVSWWLANHVQEGREHLNFSKFGLLSAEERAEAMHESAETVQEGEMPLASYTWFGLHPEANLTAAQRNTLIAWFNANGGEGGDSAGDNDDD